MRLISSVRKTSEKGGLRRLPLREARRNQQAAVMQKIEAGR
jgi:hypothetical protein